MKIPYNFDFNGDNPKVLHTLPHWCTYPLPVAQNPLYYLWNKAEIVSQQVNYVPFFIDLVEIKLREPAEIPCRINGCQLFLYFMLEGELTFTDANGSPIVVSQSHTFMISAYHSGSFAVKGEAGKHIALVITIQHEWMEKRSADFPNLCIHLREAKNRPYYTMYQCRIDRAINTWLQRIYGFSKENTGAIDGNLRKNISFILEHYDAKLPDDLAFQVKEYIDNHCTDTRLSVKSVADYFSVTERTLRNTFQRKYSESPHKYITRLRIEMAEKLEREYGLQAKDLYYRVGYTDERTYRYARERYTKNR